ncbi:MAG: response regulator transcription factor [Tissierellia bacterium]|nr:response regulator transcription factor [Tissierellia bacterium]
MTKILLLEDEKMIREVLGEYLHVAGYQVFFAVDGEEALKIIQREDVDLAILDIMVPKINGLEVLEFIHEYNPEIGVIMLTALDDEGTQLTAFNSFADDYVIKPVSPIILLKRVETILRRTKKPTVHSKDLFIDDSSFTVSYQGKELPLTVTEFLLLQTLYKHKNQSLTREQLITAIYDGDYFGSDRIIDSHIKNVRKKLPVDNIQTVTGIGYRWKEEKQ